MNHPSVDLQGSVISGEVLDLLVRGEMTGQKPVDFGLPADITLERAIGEAWTTARAKWKQFQDRRARITTNGFAETRKHWIKPLFQELGYELEGAEPELLDGNEKPYPISLRAEGLNGFPVHAVGTGYTLDERYSLGGRVQSAQALVQEYLNHSEHVYGIVTNGLQVRLLRDSTRLGRLAYVEFDLERILEQEIYPDFQAFYRLLHASRMPRKPEATEEALIERYHQHGIDSGSRIREKLRLEVKRAMETMANGLLKQNPAFAEAVQGRQVKAEDFYKALLRTIYRMLFLIVIEERDLVHAEPADEHDPVMRQRDIYRRYYSFARLRKLALRASYVDARRTDLWQSLLSTFRLFEREGHGAALGIAPLGGDLFGRPLETNGHDFHGLALSNGALLDILSGLTLTRNKQGALVAVNYNDLDVEELGSIYEGLLELHPVIDTSMGTPLFSFTPGSVRKLTGSYYTRHDLVAQLIRTALLPVMDERLKGKRTKEEKEEALLSITVLDPACGSGHFLLAAARKLSERLAQIRTGSENPGKRELIDARRDVISRCIHGVDKNPAAIELCRLALWLEAHSTSKPLTFLEHRIRPGDALVGVDKLERLREGIPDGAFEPVTGDHNKTASAFKKRNKKFRTTKQYGLFGEQLKLEADMDRFVAGYQAVEALRNDDLKDRAEKEARYAKYKNDRGWWKDKVACDLFTYAFFQRYPEGLGEHEVVDTELLLKQLNSAGSSNAALEAKALELSERERFFHWPLEFPDVWKRGGFDVVLANPPWERVKLQKKEFFTLREPKIAHARTASERDLLIEALEEEQPQLLAEYEAAQAAALAQTKFIQESGRFELSNSGDINLYGSFVELMVAVLSTKGRVGTIVPTGIVTDKTYRRLFSSYARAERVHSFYGFKNERFLFPKPVEHTVMFALITIHGSSERTDRIDYCWLAYSVEMMNDLRRRMLLKYDDFELFNPNTLTAPTFITSKDFNLTADIYARLPVIDRFGCTSPYAVRMTSQFHMTNDSKCFKSRKSDNALVGSRVNSDGGVLLPLYEAKYIHQFNHRWATFSAETDDAANIPESAVSDCQWCIETKHYVLPDVVSAKNKTTRNWVLVYRCIARSTDERAFIASVVPFAGIGNSMNCQYVLSEQTAETMLLLVNENTLLFDYVARQKIGGPNVSIFIVEQLPIVPSIALRESARFILSAGLELLYHAWELKAFADDLWREAGGELRQALRTQWEENRRATGGHGWVQPAWKSAYPEIDWDFAKGDQEGAQGGIPFPPFKWDEERRAHLRAELDAYYALLYGLERDELRYILDPKEVHGEDFPGETFRVLKDKEIKQFGEYRTRRLVLEAYDRLRPTWDMSAHLERLRVEYERLQKPAEEKTGNVVSQPQEEEAQGLWDKQGGKGKKYKLKGGGGTVQEPEAGYGLFGEEG